MRIPLGWKEYRISQKRSQGGKKREKTGPYNRAKGVWADQPDDIGSGLSNLNPKGT